MGADQNYISFLGKMRNPVTGQTEHINQSRAMLALGYEIDAHGDPTCSGTIYHNHVPRKVLLCNFESKGDSTVRAAGVAPRSKAGSFGSAWASAIWRRLIAVWRFGWDSTIVRGHPGEDAWGSRAGRSEPMDMTTSTRQAGDVTIVDITGRIALGQESAAVRNLIMDLLSQGHTKILLNMAGVDYVDSSGLGMLVSSMTSVRKAGGEIKLVNLSDKVDDLMEVTRLYTVFDIPDNEEAALKSFGRSTAAGA